MEMGISPDLVANFVTPGPSVGLAEWVRNQEAAPMVGWPAKGISQSVVKMSMVRFVASVTGCTKMLSERLNSCARVCFWRWVRAWAGSSGRKTTASGLPL